jgi:transcriptional regulator GlxA family with amidase domain
MTHRISVVIFPGFQLLDAAGPIAAFEIAECLERGAYTLQLLAPSGGRVASSSRVALEALPLSRLGRTDTLLVVGGDGTREAISDIRFIRWLRRAAERVPRVTSVCSGSLLLAQAGLLDGRRATTHWSRVVDMKKRFPAVRVEPDGIWVRDGRFWTSAGITAGIDLALALVAEDLGAAIARDVARQLVVYAQRPGGQTQHSRLLDLGPAGGRFAELNAWVRQNLDRDLGVEVLAARANMSPRTFARNYAAETGVTPAKAVERLRVEAARALIEGGERSMLEVATQTGFGELERMRRAFVRLFGRPPSAMRRELESPRALTPSGRAVSSASARRL